MRFSKWILAFLLAFCVSPVFAEQAAVTTNAKGMIQRSSFSFAIGPTWNYWEGYGIDNGAFSAIRTSKLSNNYSNSVTQKPLGSSFLGPVAGAQIKLFYNYEIELPFLTMDNFLMRNNYVKFKGTAELSPVSMNLEASATISPLALLKFSAGARIGTGWSFFGLFNGLGRNVPGTNKILVEPLSGLIYSLYADGTFQFDTGAIIKGDWTHVLLVATGRILYYGNTGAKDTEAWLYEADEGENINGWKFQGTYVIGYQFPALVAPLKMVAVMFDSDTRISYNSSFYEPISTGGWGSDFTVWRITPIVNFSLSPTDSLTALCYFRNRADYSDSTIFNRYFTSKSIVGNYWHFYQLIFKWDHTF